MVPMQADGVGRLRILKCQIAGVMTAAASVGCTTVKGHIAFGDGDVYIEHRTTRSVVNLHKKDKTIMLVNIIPVARRQHGDEKTHVGALPGSAFTRQGA